MVRHLLNINNINTGFCEIPSKTSLNVYLQGCDIKCSGCQNPDLQAFTGGSSINWTDFYQIIQNHPLCTWVCWLGGEPTCQETSLEIFNSLIKTNTNHKICMYTGRYFNNLSKTLLADIDLIIDGPWEGVEVKEENSNQKVYFKENDKWNNIKYSEIASTLQKEIC